MYLLTLGVLLVVCKLAELDPVVEWSWWAILAPFPLASVWWLIADFSGLTKKAAEAREEQRRVKRIRRHIEYAQRRGTRRT